MCGETTAKGRGYEGGDWESRVDGCVSDSGFEFGCHAVRLLGSVWFLRREMLDARFRASAYQVWRVKLLG